MVDGGFRKEEVGCFFGSFASAACPVVVEDWPLHCASMRLAIKITEGFLKLKTASQPYSQPSSFQSTNPVKPNQTKQNKLFARIQNNSLDSIIPSIPSSCYIETPYI